MAGNMDQRQPRQMKQAKKNHGEARGWKRKRQQPGVRGSGCRSTGALIRLQPCSKAFNGSLFPQQEP